MKYLSNTKKIFIKKNYILLTIFAVIVTLIYFNSQTLKDEFFVKFNKALDSDTKQINYLLTKHIQKQVSDARQIAQNIKPYIHDSNETSKKNQEYIANTGYDLELLSIYDENHKRIFNTNKEIKDAFNKEFVKSAYLFKPSKQNLNLHILIPMDNNVSYYKGHMEFYVSADKLFKNIRKDIFKLKAGMKNELSIYFNFENNSTHNTYMYGYLKDNITLNPDRQKDVFVYKNSKFVLKRVKQMGSLEIVAILNSDFFKEKSFFLNHIFKPFILLILFILLLNFLLNILIKEFLKSVKGLMLYRTRLKTLIENDTDLRVIISGRIPKEANKKFLDFVGCDSIKDFTEKYNTIGDLFKQKKFKSYISHYIGRLFWFQYIHTHPGREYRALISNSDGLEKEFFVKVIKITEHRKDQEFLVIFQDIHEAIKQRNHLNEIIYTDYETGLENENKLNEILEYRIKKHRRGKSKFMLFFIDIDKFDNINKAYGEKAGTEAIKIIANRLKRNLRELDVLVRVKEDKFAIIIDKYTNMVDLVNLADRISSKISESFTIDMMNMFVSSSMGICIYPTDGTSADGLINNAKVSVGLAKRDGGDRYYLYDEILSAQLNKTKEILSDVHFALKTNELYMQYAPQVDLKNDKIVGIDVITKWNHPLHGQLPIEEFIEAAKDSDLIIELENTIIRKATAELSKLLQKRPMQVYFKISSRNFNKPNFIQIFLNQFDDSGIDLNLINIKVSEDIIIDEKTHKDVNAKFKFLAKHGVNVVLDNFGIGKTSTLYVQKFSIDKLKIDTSITNDLKKDSNNYLIVKSIVEIAKNFNIQTIANDIKTPKDEDMINELKVDIYTGDIISPSVSINTLKKVIQEYNEKHYKGIWDKKKENKK